jgi:GNAT superfamily N-acetyltransferase
VIRAGTTDDIPEIIRMAEQFWQNTEFREEVYDPYMVEAMSQACIGQGLMAVLDSDGVHGFACGIAGPLLASGDVLAGTEMAWWVDESHRTGRNGIELLRALEKMAKAAGVKYWTMIFMESSMPSMIERIYKKMGYKLTETSYMRVL